tara:strand:- start:4408 stop:4590 length:183 start_codon:yes stop_codon:yes gene_type:complete
MKVGDLVQLSAKGDVVKSLSTCKGKFGVVVEKIENVYKVMWQGNARVKVHTRAELKYAKA